MQSSSDNPMDEQAARVYNLGGLGHLLQVQVPEAPANDSDAASIRVSRERPRPLIVLDRSGSMGMWAQVVVEQALPAILEQLGYASGDSMTLITFDSRTERIQYQGRDPEVGELGLLGIRNRGCTNMASAVSVTGEVLMAAPQQAFIILVVSDGEIGDKEATLARATALAQPLSTRAGGVQVGLVRLKTSQRGSPDTRALACMGSFATLGQPAVVDVTAYEKGGDETALLQLVSTSVSCFDDVASGAKTLLHSGAPILRRLPTASPVDHMWLPCGAPAFVLLACDDVSRAELTLGEQPLTVVECGAPQDEGAVMAFLRFAEAQLRMWAVMGSREADLATMRSWFEQLQTTIEAARASAAAAQTQPGSEAVSLSVLGRARAMAAAAKKRKASVLGRLLELSNASRVSGLNAQQQADFLRGVDNSSSGRRLAKRAAKHGDGEDYSAGARRSLTALHREMERRDADAAKAAPPAAAAGAAMDEDADDEDEMASFYSQANAMECLEAGCELAQNEEALEVLGAADVLQVVGGVGVPFEAAPSNYPDPWAFRVDKLYAGITLAECDVWLAHTQGKGKGLACPGRPGSAITGVIPLRCADTLAYRLYTETAKTVAELHASVSLRRVIAPVPFDIMARDTAAVWWLVQKLATAGSLLQVERELLCELAANIRHAFSRYGNRAFRPLIEDMVTQADPRPYLTGDREVGNVLKLVAVCVGSSKVLGRLVDPETGPALLRAMYELQVYHGARRHFYGREDDRNAELHAVLGVDVERQGTRCTALFEEEPEPVPLVSVWDAAASTSALEERNAWLPDPHAMRALVHVLRALDGDAEQGLAKPMPSPESDPCLGGDASLVHAVMAARAIACARERDRVNTETREALTPDVGSDDVCRDHLNHLVREQYAADYAERLAAKQEAERAETVRRLVAELTACADREAFVQLLQGIANRNAPGYVELRDAVLDQSVDVPERHFKAMVLLLGRTLKGREIWAKGNVLPVALWDAFEPLFAHHRKTWAAMKSVQQEFGMHKYRDDQANRHGHGDDFPSFMAMGFTSLYHMKASVDAATFEAYMQAHYVARGCCAPDPFPPRKYRNMDLGYVSQPKKKGA